MEQTPKFLTVEIFFLVALGLVADAVSIVPYVNILSSLIALIVTQWWFRRKGVKANYALVGNLIDAIPIISVLPALTVTIVAVIIITNRQADKTQPNSETVII